MFSLVPTAARPTPAGDEASQGRGTWAARGEGRPGCPARHPAVAAGHAVGASLIPLPPTDLGALTDMASSVSLRIETFAITPDRVDYVVDSITSLVWRRCV